MEHGVVPMCESSLVEARLAYTKRWPIDRLLDSPRWTPPRLRMSLRRPRVTELLPRPGRAGLPQAFWCAYPTRFLAR